MIFLNNVYNNPILLLIYLIICSIHIFISLHILISYLKNSLFILIKLIVFISHQVQFTSLTTANPWFEYLYSNLNSDSVSPTSLKKRCSRCLRFISAQRYRKKKKKILEEFLQRDYSIQFQKLLSDSIRISIKSTLLPHEFRTRWNNSRKGRKGRECEKEEPREKKKHAKRNGTSVREKEAYYSRARMECDREGGGGGGRGGRSCSQAREETL